MSPAPDSYDEMQWPASLTVTHPGSSDFAEATERWCIYEAPTFSSAVSPIGEQQVADIVSVAKTSVVARLTLPPVGESCEGRQRPISGHGRPPRLYDNTGKTEKWDSH